MHKFARWALAFGLCLSLLVCGALAADDSNIKVQLDGQDLVFTDAVPQVVDQRTFLPFRAVFEAMGADVDYEGLVITAVRGDKTLTMTIGSTEATVTQGDVVTPIVMDVAPYVDGATWRTYVPVRFAAQAFDCVVGWDQDAYTAIIIDAEKLVSEAMEGKNYTILAKFFDEDPAVYDTGLWDLNGTLDANVSVTEGGETAAMAMTGAIKATFLDGAQGDLEMTLKLDMADLLAAMGDEEMTEEDQAILNSLTDQGITVRVRGDEATGLFYANLDLGDALSETILNELGQALGLELDLDLTKMWFGLDINALMELLDLADLESMESAKLNDMLPTLLNYIGAGDAQTGYATLKAIVTDCLNAFQDESFVQEGNTYTATYTLMDMADVTLALEMEDDTVTSRVVGVDMDMEVEEDTTVAIAVLVTVDAQGQMKIQYGVDMDQVAVDMTMDFAYTPGTAAPEVEPPADADVIDLTPLLQIIPVLMSQLSAMEMA